MNLLSALTVQFAPAPVFVTEDPPVCLLGSLLIFPDPGGTTVVPVLLPERFYARRAAARPDSAEPF